MDQLTAFVELAYIKLRLELIDRALQKVPRMPLIPPKLPAPIQLAGLGARLKRGASLEARANAVGTRVDNAHDVIESGIAALENYEPGLEQYGSQLLTQIQRLSEPSNGGPPLESEGPTQQEAPVPGPNGGPRIHT